MFGAKFRRTQFFVKTFLPHTSSSQRRCFNSLTLENIQTHGSLIIRSPRISANVRCINPHEVPNGDKSFISLTSTRSDLDLNQFQIHYEKDNSVIRITLPDHVAEGEGDTNIHVEVPHIYDLDIEAGNVNVVETEGDNLNVNAEQNCTLGKIKSLNTNLVSGGYMKAKNLYGDGMISVQKDLHIGKLQSSRMDMSAESVDMSAAFCRDLICKTEAGDIKIADLHGVANVTSTSGNVTIGTVDGDLSVSTQNGNIDVTVEKCTHVDVQSTDGDIAIGVGDSLSAFLEASGKHIDVPEDLLVDGMKRHSSTGDQTFEGRLGKGDASVVSRTSSGAVSYSRKNWFSKFKYALD